MPEFTPPFRLAGALLGILVSLAAQAQSARLRIVALGASNTAGWGVAAAEAYPAQLEALLAAKGMPATVLNAGIPGDTTGGMLARLEREVAPGTDLVILQPGTNDERAGSGAERAGNIAEIERRLAARGTKLLIVENSMLAELPPSELREDGIHFTPQGYAILAQRVLPLLLEALPGR
ncbi:MAG TPA: GDSL-type esterase/lipase family protein [Hyphomicrobiaceae bacterium]|jgi:acyl-CoA thioesterase-1|nr:GDSL-type esterase/lipase family protein [Hyphomicrobiaceae bacterium]